MSHYNEQDQEWISLLTSFPKLIPINIQHTSVETAEVRYVYKPLEDLNILVPPSGAFDGINRVQVRSFLVMESHD